MKILWITNIYVGEACIRFGDKKKNGLWLDFYLNKLIQNVDVELIVVTSANIKETEYFKSGSVTYYRIPGGDAISKYNYKSKKNIKNWQEILEKENPDIINIWGTEGTLGIAAQQARRDIPCVIFIQGLLKSFVRYYDAGIDMHTQMKMKTYRNIIKHDAIKQIKESYKKRACNEKKMLTSAGNYIYENTWCKSNCSEIAPGSKGYKLSLCINDVFLKYQWEKKDCEYKIICPYMYSPFKGYHIMLHAVSLVKKRYPNVKLCIPGIYKKVPRTFIEKIKYDDYSKYLNYLIEKYDLYENIEYIGYITQNELAQRFTQSDIFVMCSAIENQSSTLKEAMAVGMPCIASNVGGVMEYGRHMENMLIYRFEEYELLAEYIIMLFENSDLREKLSENAVASMKNFNDQEKAGKILIDIYRNIIKNSNGY